jgi:hypothetical protein
MRAAAEKLSGATTATPPPITRKPRTATGQTGANTVTASPRHATSAPTRSIGTAPYRATRVSPESRTSPLASRYGKTASATSAAGVGNTSSRYCGPHVNAAVSTM